MKYRIASAFLAAAMSFSATGDGPSQHGSDADRQQIVAFMAALDETWNRHDMRAHADLLHEDGVWIAWTGQAIEGRRNYEDTLADLHKTVFRNSVHTGRIEELKFVAPDVAVVRGYGTVIGNEPTPDKVHRYRILVVMTRRDGVWRMSWGQKTRFLDSTPDPQSGK